MLWIGPNFKERFLKLKEAFFELEPKKISNKVGGHINPTLFLHTLHSYLNVKPLLFLIHKIAHFSSSSLASNPSVTSP